MFQALFNIIINLLATIIQIVVWPINQVISTTMPDLTAQINQVNNGLATIFNGIGWALGLLPPGILGVLTFILGIEIAKHTIFISTHTLTKVWNLLQKLKFW